MMARSTLGQTSTLMSELSRDYEITAEEEIQAFPYRYPEVGPLLPEVRTVIRKYFGDERVKLELFYDPEWEDDDPPLFLNIQTHFGAGEALRRLKQFDHDWWLDKLKQMKAPLVVSINHVRRV
jgi:hypothetical protein